MRYLATVSYNGSAYYGWQKQVGKISIQEIIEGVLSMILDKETKIYASGRTDAGVHSLGQTFHFDAKEIKDLGKFTYSINSLLPKDIFVDSIIKVDDNFHARYNVKRKIYSYYINIGKYDLFKVDEIYQFLRPLDIEKMKECLNIFLGEHCFQNFTSKDEDENNYVRIIYDAKLSLDNDIIKIIFEGNGFMRYMVRMIVGTLIEVGLGKLKIEEVKAILDDKNRNVVSYKAPANGLYLDKVIY